MFFDILDKLDKDDYFVIGWLFCYSRSLKNFPCKIFV
jgi:hypothetical protein